MNLSDLVPMSIKGLMLDPVSNSPIVVLKDDDEKFFLPIWVGIFEANAIALQLENITTPRPMTHDLLRNLIAQLDARPSDAIALALRTEAPIYVAQSVLEQAQTITPEASDEQQEKSKDWFENLSTEDLGKYKM